MTPRDKFTRVLLLIAALVVLVFGGLWAGGVSVNELFRSAPPTVEIVQPSQAASLNSGEGFVLIVAGNSQAGVTRFVLSLNQQPISEYRLDDPQQRAIASFAWYATELGEFELSVIAYDDDGRASLPASVQVQVIAAQIPGLVEGADFRGDSGPADLVNAPPGLAAAPADPANEEDAVDEDPPVLEDDPAQDEAGEALPPPPADEEAELPPAADIAADDQAPIVELQVDVSRLQGALVASVFANGTDNLGLDFLRLSISTPGGENVVHIQACGGEPVCMFEHNIAIGEGEWIFHLQGFDLVPQASEPVLTSRQIICQLQNGELLCSVVERRDALAEILEDFLRNQRPIWEQLVNGEFFDPNELIADFPLLGERAEQPRNESFELRGCLIVQPVHANNPPAPPVTDCPDHNLSGEDLSGIDLRGANFERTDLRQANLSDAQLNWARLFATDLRGANLQNAELGRAEMRAALLSGADLTAAYAHAALLSGAEMEAIIAPHIDLRNAFLISADLAGADLRASWLDGANFEDADLSGANLSATSLVGANLEGAVMPGINLQRADLRNANLFRAQLRFEGGNPNLFLLNGAIYNNTTCPDGTNSDDNGGACTGSNLAPYFIQGCIIVVRNQYPEPPLTDCSGLDMRGADFEGRDLRGANFTGATLIGADMSGGDFRAANFTNASLLGAQAFQASYAGAIWNNTICPDGSNSDEHSFTCEGFLFP